MRSRLYDYDWKYGYGYPELNRDVRDRHGKVVANYREPRGGLLFNVHHVVRTGDWWAVRLFAYSHTNGHSHGPQRHDHNRHIAELLFGPALEERRPQRWDDPRLLYRGDPRQHQRYDVITKPKGMWPLECTLPATLMAAVDGAEAAE